MKEQHQRALVLRLLIVLEENGSWCGETHLQKTAFCLKDITKVPFDYDFILYKHGPFSFDLKDELSFLRAYDLIRFIIRQYPYGPSLSITERGQNFLEKYPKIQEKYKVGLNFIGKTLSNKNVAELEQIATALYITKKESIKEAAVITKRINEIKPHITLEKAAIAVKNIEDLSEEWKKESCPVRQD